MRNIWLVLLLLALLLAACSTGEAPQQPGNTQTTSDNNELNQSGEDSENTEPVNSSSDSNAEIMKMVKEAVSPDKKCIASIVQTKNGYNLLVKKDNKFEELANEKYALTELTWSPNGKYLYVGNSEIGIGKVLGIDGRTLVHFYFSSGSSGPFWSPDGEKLSFTVREDVRKGSNYEGFTTDAVVLNLKNGFEKRFAKGTLDFYYTVESWEEDGTIKYSKRSQKDYSLMEKLDYVYAHHIYSLDINTGEKKLLASIKDLEYSYFSPSPDRQWLSLVRITGSAGEGESGIPAFFDLQSEAIKELGEEYSWGVWDWDAQWFKDSSSIVTAHEL